MGGWDGRKEAYPVQRKRHVSKLRSCVRTLWFWSAVVVFWGVGEKRKVC